MKVTITVNGESKTWDVAPGDILLDLLRWEGYLGVKRGCEDGSCGLCTVLLDGLAINSCTLLAAQADGRHVTTIEGLGRREHLHPLQQSFVELGAIQCGYCTPAMILAAKALLNARPQPTEAEVRDALSGIYCRCTGYVKPVEAVLRVARQSREA
jgi:aerobic-type carbon monoxide dehydrogenase small subunit (CoxS/CutS family)